MNSDTNTVYVWGLNIDDAQLVGRIPRYTYQTLRDALEEHERGEDGIDGETLYAVTEGVATGVPESEYTPRMWVVQYVEGAFKKLIKTDSMWGEYVAASTLAGNNNYDALVTAYEWDAYETAIKAWDEAGYSKAPKEVPQPKVLKWWWVSKLPSHKEFSAEENNLGKTFVKVSSDGNYYGRLQAYDEKGAIDAAWQAVRDLAHKVLEELS